MLNELVDFSNELGIKTVNGKRWSKETVRNAWGVILSDKYQAFAKAYSSGALNTVKAS